MRPLFFFFILISCNYRIDKAQNNGPVSAPRELLETISFQQLKKEVFVPKCISCHGNAGGVNLESHASAHRHMNAIQRSVLQTKSMPKAPVSPLTDRQLELMIAWVDAGGPEHARGGGVHELPETQTPSDPNALNFQKISEKIIERKCLSCHMAGEHAASIPLDTREQLLAKLVVPGKPEESLFYTITIPGAMNMMPPYPVSPLTNKERKLIEKWIREGAN